MYKRFQNKYEYIRKNIIVLVPLNKYFLGLLIKTMSFLNKCMDTNACFNAVIITLGISSI